MPSEYTHYNLNDVDDSRKPVDANIYTLEINKLEPVYRTVKSPTSVNFGKEFLVIRGSYTIVDDPKFSGRKLWKDFWTNQKVALIFLKKQMVSTGVLQTDTQELEEWASQFATFNPSARFQVPVGISKPWGDPEGDDENSINFFQCKAV